MDGDASPVGSGLGEREREPAADGMVSGENPEPSHQAHETPDGGELATVRKIDGSDYSIDEERQRQRALIEARKTRAAEKKRQYEGMLAGAELRAERTDRKMIGKLGFAVAQVMLARVLNGEFPVRDARQATDVAKVALEVGRLELGDPAANPNELTPERREALIAAAKQLEPELRRRRQELEKAREENEAALDVTSHEPADG